MNRQGPPNWPRYQLTRGLNRFRHRKRCYDVILSRQEGSTMRHLANAQYWTGLAGGNTGRLFPTFGRLVCADRISNCPLDRVLTYKSLIISHREGDYEMMPVCSCVRACVRVCVRALVTQISPKLLQLQIFCKLIVPMNFHALENFFGFMDLGLKISE